MKIRIHKPIYGVPITFLDKWRPFEPVYILNPDRYANEYIISSVIKPFSYFCCLIPNQFRIIGCTESEGKGFSNGLWNGGVTQPMVDNKRIYKRLFIQKV